MADTCCFLNHNVVCGIVNPQRSGDLEPPSPAGPAIATSSPNMYTRTVRYRCQPGAQATWPKFDPGPRARVRVNCVCALGRGYVFTDAGDGDHLHSIVRPYVVTGGRTRAKVDLALESLVQTTELGRAMASAVLLHPEERQ